jgi:molybdopterin-guanine dinucleotide biosynthesis protein MobB
VKIIAVVGRSGSGKTRLITRLLPELKARGLTVAVIKHCGHGFDLGGPDKDSSQYLAAGAADVGLAGPTERVWIRRGGPEISLARLAESWFPGADLVLVEGGKNEAGLRKIEVLRDGAPAAPESVPAVLAAIVADGKTDAPPGVPVFHPDCPGELADWLKGET